MAAPIGEVRIHDIKSEFFEEVLSALAKVV